MGMPMADLWSCFRDSLHGIDDHTTQKMNSKTGKVNTANNHSQQASEVMYDPLHDTLLKTRFTVFMLRAILKNVENTR